MYQLRERPEKIGGWVAFTWLPHTGVSGVTEEIFENSCSGCHGHASRTITFDSYGAGVPSTTRRGVNGYEIGICYARA